MRLKAIALSSLICFLVLTEATCQDFRVQIAAFADSVSNSYFRDRGVHNVIASVDQMGMHRYFSGSYTTREEAEAVVDQLVPKGFPNATIIDLEEQRVLCGQNCPYMRNGFVFVQEPSQEMTVRNIFFEFGRYNLSLEAREELELVGQRLREDPALRLSILGYTDALGSPEANVQLATNRARAARNYLINKGVNAERLYIKVYGEAEPLAPNMDDFGKDLPDNRRWNRRVVLALIDPNGQVHNDKTVVDKQ